MTTDRPLVQIDSLPEVYGRARSGSATAVQLVLPFELIVQDHLRQHPMENSEPGRGELDDQYDIVFAAT